MSAEVLKDALNMRIFGLIKDNTAYLKEESREAELKSFKIKRLPEGSLLLALDKVDTQTLFKKGNGQNMRCDYLLYSNETAYFM